MVQLEDFKNNFKDFITNFLISFFILILFLILANYTKNLIINLGTKKVKSENLETELIKRDLIYDQFSNIIYYITIFLGVIFAVINLGIQQNTVLTILGSFGLALGLALQGLITNFIAGIYITLNNLFKINDIIRVQNFSGRVIAFTLLNTIIRDTNNNIIHIPNNILRDNVITNFSK